MITRFAKHATKSRSRRREAASIFGAILIASSTLGCQKESKTSAPSAERIPPAPLVQEQSLGTRVQPTLVRQGPLPLVYINESPANLRFIDMTTGRELGSVRVGAQQIVSFDAKRGVVVAETPIVSGSLDAAHVYGIIVEPAQTSSVRTTTGQPLPPPRPPRNVEPPHSENQPPATQSTTNLPGNQP